MSLVLTRPEISMPQMAFMTDAAQEILQFAADSVDEGFETALVTLVEIRGGAARALGAQMAVRRDGLYCGYVSGGCTEAAVAAEALQAIAGGNDRFLRLGKGHGSSISSCLAAVVSRWQSMCSGTISVCAACWKA